MFTKCILLSTLATKAQGMCEGAAKQSSVLKNYTVSLMGANNGTYFPESL